MKNLSPKEAITILEGMRIDIPVPKAAVTQIKRNLALDMAINALNCSEIPNNSDTISRQAAIDAVIKRDANCGIDSAEVLKKLPSAQPEIIYCKDCKYWKDSDGVYRRGLDAESKCPLNLKEVYEGTFYCGMAKRKE